jgi:hypothetical protein
MAGEGLIWSGIGQGIANAGSTMGQYLMRSQEREADRAYREAQAQETRDFRAEQNALYRRPVDDQSAGRAGGRDAGLQPADTAPGGAAANMMANKMGMSEAEYENFYKANKTGDFTDYAQEVPNRGEENVIAGSKEVPQALKEEFALKRKVLGDLQETYALKKDFKEVMQGRQVGLETNIGQGVLAGAIPLGKGSGAVAAMGGKQILNTEGGETYNMYTFESKTTPLGKAQIGKENAQAGELGALGKKYGKDIEKIDAEIQGGMFNKNSSEKITASMNSLKGQFDSLMKQKADGLVPKDQMPAWQVEVDAITATQAQYRKLLSDAATMKANPPAPKPDTPNKPARNKVFNPKTGNFE